MSGRGKSFNGNRGNRSYRSSKQPQASIHSTPISNSSDKPKSLKRTQEDLDTLVSRAATMQDAYCESDIEEATESTNQTRRSSYSDVVKSFPTQDDRSNDCVKS
uniref:Uncharacterized protein n=1 Tax=Magallana gigas TaxID=29159 RepID=A0A8W8LIU1_MAGGI